jgi:hypothetical protein
MQDVGGKKGIQLPEEPDGQFATIKTTYLQCYPQKVKMYPVFHRDINHSEGDSIGLPAGLY